MLRRLRSAGCPVDPEHLPQPRCPLRDFRKTTIKGTNIFPIAGGYGIAFGIKALACAALTVCQFDLRANWFKQPISWIRPCDRHPNQYCFHLRSAGHNDLAPSGNVLTRKTWLLGRGDYLEGLLLGALHESLPSTLGKTLEATLSIADLAGNEYHFPVSLLNEITQTAMKQPIGEPLQGVP
jgi:hypothetical protein